MKIVDSLFSHYLELENLWLSVKDQIDADVQWKPRAMERFTHACRELHTQFGLLDDDENLTDDVNHMSMDEQLVKLTAKERNPENIDLPENRVRYTDILHDALLVTPDNIVETFLMDSARVFGFQNEGQLIVVIAALLMLVQNIVSEGRGDKAFLAGLKDRLVVMLKAPEELSLENLALDIIANCEALVLEKKRSRLRVVGKESEEGSLEGLDENRMVHKTLSTKDPVFGLLKRRVQACIKAHVVSGSFKREGLDKAGLDVVRIELEAFSYRVAIWVRYNEVYGEWYDEILKDLI
ncbi:UNVERIFIED_CONTAM: hypothetical protein HDU68_008709 [Siphonaria sp. JEL0065]|nr:hypothetical protein HDU68_008709 [Siphonaria sp. JEL0065]